MTTIRHPAVAGMFYPSMPRALQIMIERFLSDAASHADLPIPKAIIAPHAGYIYSGPIAASAYACLKHAGNKIKNVVILGPAHRYPVRGIAVTGADFYGTPLGNVKINLEVVNKLLAFPFVHAVEEAYDVEHALEVHLPFLQSLLTDFELVPLLIGDATTEQVATLLRAVWNVNGNRNIDGETLIIISSDLSHYYDYEEAQRLDNEAAQAILMMNPNMLDAEMACGYLSICGLLTVAVEKKMHVTQVDLRNSGDTAGDKNQVVGYGAFHFVSN